MVLDREVKASEKVWKKSGRRWKKQLLLSTENWLTPFWLSAIGALQVAKERGIKVHDDITIIGFDGIEAVKYTDPPLPTVEQPLGELGKIAAEILVERIRGGEEKKIVLPCRLVEWEAKVAS